MNSRFMMILYALLAGFATNLLLAFAFTKLMARNAAGRAGMQRGVSAGRAAVDLGAAFVAGVTGGYVAGWIAHDDPMGGTLALAMVVLVMGAVSVLERRGKQPLGFQLAMVALSPVGVLAGGLLRLKVLGLTWSGTSF